LLPKFLAKLETDPKTGLNAAQLQERLKKYGPNALAEEKKSALSAFLAYFWGPIPWMIEAAALMALIDGSSQPSGSDSHLDLRSREYANIETS
jgi:magnesium-transporting ATPase (P-type)